MLSGSIGSYSGFKTQSGITLQLKVTPPLPFADTVFLITNGPHIDGFNPLMKERPNAGERQLISRLDALLVSQLSSFERPDLSDPPLDGDNSNQRTKASYRFEILLRGRALTE